MLWLEIERQCEGDNNWADSHESSGQRECLGYYFHYSKCVVPLARPTSIWLISKQSLAHYWINLFVCLFFTYKNRANQSESIFITSSLQIKYPKINNFFFFFSMCRITPLMWVARKQVVLQSCLEWNFPKCWLFFKISPITIFSSSWKPECVLKWVWVWFFFLG